MKYFFTLILLIATFLPVQAQVETRYYSSPQHSLEITRAKELVRNSSVHRMSSFDVKALLKEDSIMDECDVPYRFGMDFPLSLTLDDGEWHQLDNGRVWTISFESAGALSLNFIFDNFYLPEGATLEIINDDATAFYGPVNSKAIPDNGHFMTDLIPGEKACIYLYEPSECIGKSTLTITRLIHAYRGLNLNAFANRGLQFSCSCNVDVACHPEYAEESKGVGLVMLANGTELCSGSLLMSTDMSFKPYFLTAFHCIDSSSDGSLSSAEKDAAENWMFKFNFKKEECNGSTIAASTTYNGAIFRAAWNNTDFALVEVNHDLKTNPSLYWLGWDRSGSTPTNGACIHHPWGGLMKISIEDDSFTTVQWNATSNEYNHWGVNFDEGVVEMGSSGSPLLNGNHKVVGQLHGVVPNSNCCLQTNALYGKFNISWSGGGTNATRLSNWLDSIGTNALTINGYTAQSIIGPTIPCDTSIYYVSNLPSNYSVTWSWKNFCLIPITQNSPYTNYCTITRDNSSYINNTLVATISKNGSTVSTIEKVIDTTGNFSGFYSQEAFTHPNLSYPAVVGVPFNHDDILILHKGSTITLQSNSFIGATISRTGHTVHDWTVSGNTISFRFKYLSPNIINPYDPDLVARPGEPASITITGQRPGTCEQFWFTVIGTDLPNLLDLNQSYNLSVNNSGNDYTFSVSGQTADATRSVEQIDVPTWKLIIVNTITGQVLFTGDVKDKPMTINTSEWGAGIYSARAIIGEEILTQKFIKK